MEYQIVVLTKAEADIDGLTPPIREIVIRRVHWLAQNCLSVIHHRLAGMPKDLEGLCKFRVGDYRVLYWKNDAMQQLQIFRVRHRSDVYRGL